MHKQITTGLTALVAAGALAATTAPAQAATASERQGTRSLATVLAADGNHFDHDWHDFDIVDKAVHTVLKAKPDSPVGVLADGTKRLTAFLPTDAAFQRLATQLSGTKPHTERGTFRAVTKVADVDTLETILLYHVVPGATITAKQAAKADGAHLATAAGKKITVHVRHGQVRLADQDPNARNARVIPHLTDLNKGNRQVAHGVTQVLRPVDL
jgi:uncharacterized surface protein with fasciclin (FAS1) repeats